MTFLGLEARTDLPKVPYPTALDFFVFLSFAFIFATIIQVSHWFFHNLNPAIKTKHFTVCCRSLFHKIWIRGMLFRHGTEFRLQFRWRRASRKKETKGKYFILLNNKPIPKNKNKISNTGCRQCSSSEKLQRRRIYSLIILHSTLSVPLPKTKNRTLPFLKLFLLKKN